MSRHFRALRSITLPRDLVAGPGATNMRLEPGQVVTCEDAACMRQQRFINGRKREQDIEELAELPADAAPGAPVQSADTHAHKLGQTVAAPAKKER